MVGMRMGDDQLGNMDVRQRAFEQRGPGRDRFLVAETGIHHRPAVAVGEQIDVHVVEAERQLEPNPQHAGHHLDHLVGAGMLLPGVSQCLRRGLNRVCLRMHDTGLAAHAAGRQPKKQMRPPKRPHGSVVIPGWSHRVGALRRPMTGSGPDPESRDSGFYASHSPGMTVATDRRLCRPDVGQEHVRNRCPAPDQVQGQASLGHAPKQKGRREAGLSV